MCSVQGRVRSCKSPWIAHGTGLARLGTNLLTLLYNRWLYMCNWLFFVTRLDPATSILLSTPCYKNPKEENKMLKYSVSALSQNLGNLKRNAVFITGLMALLISGAFAQEQRSEISIQGTGFYTKDATGNAVRQRATDTGGFLVDTATDSIAGCRLKQITDLTGTRNS